MACHRFRRIFFTGNIALLCLLLLVPGCGRQGRAKVVIRFWNGFTGPDGRTMLRLVKRFNQENPDVEVLMQRMEWATYYKKLFVAGIGQRAPELFVIHTNALTRFAQAAFVRPLDDLASTSNYFPINDIDTNVWRAAQVGGKHYGLPLDVHAMGMYYNRRSFQEAGIVDAKGEPKPPQTREEFLEDCRKLTRDTPQGKRWGFVFTNMESNVYTLMRQWGGQFFSADGQTCLLNNPQNVAALQFAVDLIRKEKVAPPPEDFDAWIGFRQGKAAMAWEGVYMLDDVRKQKDLDYAGAPVPQMGIEKAVWTGSHNLCLRADLTERETKAAWRFVTFLSENSLDWAQGGQIPARRSLRESPRFAQMALQWQFARQIPYVSYMPQVPFVFEFNTEFDLAIEKALRGSAMPQAALDDATEKVNQIMARQRADLAEAQELAAQKRGGQ